MTDSYYADTSSIRRAGGGLASLLESGRLRTSVLVAIELLNGITQSEKEFRRRRSGLRTLNRWMEYRMPEQVIFSGFEALVDEFDFIEKRLESLTFIINTLDQVDSLFDFRYALEDVMLDYPLAYFTSYDQIFERVFVPGSETELREIRRLFESADVHQVDPTGTIPREVLAGSFKRFCDWLLTDKISLNESLTLMALAKSAAGMVIKTPSEELINRVYTSYNDIGYPFLKALSVKSTDLMCINSQGQRNDGMDLAHFLYLREGEILVSDDLAQRELAGRIGVRAITLNELRHVLS